MNKIRVLLAEDEFLCAIGLRNNLESLGYEVVAVATTGNELIDMTRSLKPDLIISDINMPKPNGLEAIKIINSEMDIPSIITSSYNDSHIDESTKLNIFYYLIKPINKEELNAAIKIALSRYKDSTNLKNELLKIKENIKTKKIIDQAKRILIERNHISENEAFENLQTMSKNKNIKLIKIAEEIITANDLFLSLK